MSLAGFFTSADRTIISKAAALAEGLTGRYFDLPADEWNRNPYGIYTRKELDSAFYQPDIFAQVVRYQPARGSRATGKDPRYGIVLQDPNILLALLRSRSEDLWTLGLFILTHELIHIVRFRRDKVDFFAGASDRDREERVVRDITREILSGVTNTDYILSLYDRQAELTHG
jgi:hypothetical protein